MGLPLSPRVAGVSPTIFHGTTEACRKKSGLPFQLLMMLLVSATHFGSTPLHFRQSEFKADRNGSPQGWVVWSARPEIAPKTGVDTRHSRGCSGSLVISGNSSPAAYGGWEYQLSGIEAGKWY